MTDLVVQQSPQTAVSLMDTESARATAEVQGAIISAKRFPRDVFQAEQRILTSCKRQRLAEAAMYCFPKGGQQITGPSVHLLRAIAQNWGNLDFGWRILEQDTGTSKVEAYAWDLETNVKKRMTFSVEHSISTKNGPKHLKDPRDINEHIASQAARRERACLEALIPGDIIDVAVEQCEATLQGGSEPVVDRIRKMITAFGEMGVSVEMLEKRIKHKIDVTTVHELVELQKIYRSIKDGVSGRDQWFDLGSAANTSASASAIQDSLKAMTSATEAKK